MEGDVSLHSVRKTKYRFNLDGQRMEIDDYPFSGEKAVMFVYGSPSAPAAIPDGINILREVTGAPEYKNRRLAKTQTL